MSRRLAWRALGGTAAVLSLLLGLELASPDEPAALPPAKATAPAAAANPPATPARRDPAGWADALVVRPLFDPRRKGEASAAAAGPADLPRLAGILLADGERRAIFQPDGGDKPLILGEGEQVTGWTVRRIAEDAVILERGDGSQSLQPKFDGKPRQP